MRKLKIFILLAALILAVAAFCGCNKLDIDEVKADPMTYVSAGSKMIFDGTDWSKLPNIGDLTYYSFAMDAEKEKSDLKFAFDSESKKLFLDVFQQAETEIADQYGESIFSNSEVDFTLYVNDKEIAFTNDALKDAIGTDTIGGDFSSLKNQEGTPFIKALCEITGLSEKEVIKTLEDAINSNSKGSEKDEIPLKNINKAISEYKETVEPLYKKLIKIDDVKEETLPIGKKGMETISVYASIDEKIYTEISEATVALITDIYKDITEASSGIELSDEDAESIKKTYEDMIPSVKAKYVYYLSAKTGALIRTTCKSSAKVETSPEESGAEKMMGNGAINYDVTFGEAPEILLLPEFSFRFYIGAEGIDIAGKSRIEDMSLIVEGDALFESKEDGKEEETYKLVYNEDGTYKLTIGENEINGVFKIGEKGIEFEAESLNDENDTTEKLSFSAKNTESIEKMPEYKDIFKLTEDEVDALLDLMGMGGPDYDQYFREELIWYYEIDDSELDETLANYAEAGLASEQEYLYALFASTYYTALGNTYGYDVVDSVVQEISNSGGGNYETAVGLYQLMIMLNAPDEDEVRDYIENYEDYGYSSPEEVIEELLDYYGEYVTIPEEYLY